MGVIGGPDEAPFPLNVGLILLAVCNGELSRAELQEKLGLRHRDNFIEAYLQPALNAGLLEMTTPDKPRSSKQKYRLTEKGRAVVGGPFKP